MITTRIFYVCLLCVSTLVLAGCGGATPRSKASIAAYRERPVELIYNQALDALKRRKYSEATEQFNEVERQHPYSQWARRAVVMSAFTSYLQNKYDDAIITARRFLSLYPGNEQAAYAYYLVAQSYYERISDVQRDQLFTELAQQGFIEIIRRFPDSDYARDGRLKIDLTQDHLAGKEMEVGRFYLKKRQYLAAIKRFSYVVQNYQRTSHTPEALYRLIEVYLSLGIVDEAQKSLSFLAFNHAFSEWYVHGARLARRHGVTLPTNAASLVPTRDADEAENKAG